MLLSFKDKKKYVIDSYTASSMIILYKRRFSSLILNHLMVKQILHIALQALFLRLVLMSKKDHLFGKDVRFSKKPRPFIFFCWNDITFIIKVIMGYLIL